jgi:hypothetical protein
MVPDTILFASFVTFVYFLSLAIFISLKAEAEKLFHLRLAAILDDVEAEVELSLFTLL